MVVGPSSESVFALRGATFRTSRSDADDRLLDGLVQVAIAATVFPTARELAEDATIARPPVTVDEVDDVLRRICDKLSEAAKADGDPAVSDEEVGLHEAWRVYQRRLSSQHTRDNRAGPRTTRRIIERNLERLHELGCFVQQRENSAAFQATWRYQVLVKELAATTLYRRITEALDFDVEAINGEASICRD
jgi:hypothetical protein